MADAAIVAEGLGKCFGPVVALDGVDLELPAGGVLGVLGPNGAGKTTAVRILATLLKPDRGRAWVAGFDIAVRPAEVRRRIGLSGQYAAVDPFLTGRENLIMIGRLYGLTRRQARSRAGELIGQLELADAAGRLVRTYSGGMRRRLDVAASLLAAPPVLFLDEPTTGLDPYGRLALWQVLGDLTAQGTSLLLTTQYIEEAERLAEMVVIIDHGKVIASGTPDQLKDRTGGDRLELQSPPGQDPRQLAGALAALGTGEPAIDEPAGRVVLPVADGPGILPDVADPAGRRWPARQRAGSAQAHPGGGIPGLHRPVIQPNEAPAARGQRPARGASPASSHHPEYSMSTAAGTGARPGRPASALVNTATVTGRNLRRLVRVPTLLVFATVQPVLFVLLFTYAFGGAVHVPGVAHYIDYLLPGIFVLALGFGASQTGVAIAEDLSTGMIDRFRSLPITSGAVLGGRVAADALRNLFVVALMIAVGAAVGFRFHAGSAAAFAAVVLAVAAGLAFSWLNLLLGLTVRDPESAGLAGLFPIIILFFTSSTLVPVATMPGWLQAFAKANPITVITDALRALCLGGPAARPVAEAAAWLIGLLAVTVPATIARYRHATST